MLDAVLPRDPFTTADAKSAGYPQRCIAELVRTGAWRVLRRGVYCTTELYLSTAWSTRHRHRLHILAAQLALPRRTVASGWSAAALHALPLPLHLVGQAPESVTLCTDVGRGRSFDGIELAAACLPDHQVVDEAGVLVTTPARTAIDLALSAELPDALAVADAALHRKLASVTELTEILAQFHRRAGSMRARRVIQLADARAESPLESHSRAFFASMGLPTPESQVEIWDGQGLVGRVDVLWREQRTIGEADGRLKYQDADVLYREKRREDRLRELRLEVVRWDFADIRSRPKTTMRRILAAFARGVR